MRLLRFRLPCLFLSGLTLAAAAEPGLLRGHVTGEFGVGDLIPSVPWVADVQQTSTGASRLAVTAKVWGRGVKATLELDANGEGKWALEPAGWSAEELWQQVIQSIRPEWITLQPAGTIALSGGGAWTNESPQGPLQLVWSEGRLKGAEPEIEVTGINGSFELRGWLGEERSGQGKLAFGRAIVAGVELEEGSVALRWRKDGVMVLGPGRVNALDGVLAIAPVQWPAGEGGLTVIVQAESVSLARLAALAPQAVRAATGTVSGQVVLRWGPNGVEPIDGHLVIDAKQPVDLTLAPQPGFLTRQVPRHYEFLPSWMGPVARRLSPVNPAYEMLEGVELGRVPLRVQRLEVDFYPPNDEMDRTVRILVEGRPSDGKVVDQVVIQLNLAGPLADIIRLGLDQRSQISGRLQ